MALLFLLAALHVVLLKGSISPDGRPYMWPHETMSGQLCGGTRIVCTSVAITLSVLIWIYVYQGRN